jgi:hypothetical protein
MCCALAAALVACSSDSTGPKADGNCSPSAVTLQLYEGASFDCSNGTGFTLNGAGTYLLVTQFATSEVAYNTNDFEIQVRGRASPLASAARVNARFTGIPSARGNTRQARFDGAMVAKARRLAEKAIAAAATAPAAPVAKQTLGSQRNFWVFADTEATTYKQITATLVYDGAHVFIYQDDASPQPGFSPAQLQQFGVLTDSVLYQIDVSTFAQPTDIDHNGHVIMLLTPAVNALTPAADCDAEGFVAGYFDSNDLTLGAPHSNNGEIFYGLVPDPYGRANSCPHDVQTIFGIIPGTFLHEFQHMINYGQHVIIHGGAAEAGWLDEGMAIVATELGGLHYDSLYQATGNTAYLDSVPNYVNEQFQDSYNYLQDPDTASLTLHTDADCCLEWRGGDWMMMRYIGDQFTRAIYHTLVTSTNTGTANIAASANQPFPTTFGNFAVAAYTDGLPNVGATAVPSQYRFTTWNFRTVYAQIGPFPIAPDSVSSGATTDGAMVPGTSAYYAIRISSDSATLVFGTPSGALSSSLHPQVLVFRAQ